MSRQFSSPYLAHSESPFAETIRSLRANLMPIIRGGTKSLLVTSSWAGEGKTTLVLNLGVALWEFGMKVLLVDADLRQAGLSRSLAMPAKPELEPQSLPGMPGLDMISAFQEEGCHPSELLARPDYRLKIGSSFASYQCVLVDSPCLSLCSDSLILGSWLDGALIVASRGLFRGIAEGNFAEDLRDQGIRLLGVVLTEAPVSRQGRL